MDIFLVDNYLIHSLKSTRELSNCRPKNMSCESSLLNLAEGELSSLKLARQNISLNVFSIAMKEKKTPKGCNKISKTSHKDLQFYTKQGEQTMYKD